MEVSGTQSIDLSYGNKHLMSQARDCKCALPQYSRRGSSLLLIVSGN